MNRPKQIGHHRATFVSDELPITNMNMIPILLVQSVIRQIRLTNDSACCFLYRHSCSSESQCKPGSPTATMA